MGGHLPLLVLVIAVVWLALIVVGRGVTPQTAAAHLIGFIGLAVMGSLYAVSG
jgi:hypothetical protein